MSLPALLLCSLLASPMSTTTSSPASSSMTSPSMRVLVIVPGASADVDAAVREGLQARADLAVLDAAATTSLLHDAHDAGLSCDDDDAPCWLRVATLGGLDAAVLAHGQRVSFVTTTTTSAAATIGTTPTAWAAATRRALGLEGALRFGGLPPGARVQVDGVPVDGVQVDGVRLVAVAPGPHALLVDAAGFAPLRERVSVEAGAIVDVALALVAVPAPAPSPPTDARASTDGTSSTLWWSGVGALGVSAVGAAVLVAVGQVPYLRCYDADAPAGCASDGAITSTANSTAVAALVVGGVGLLAGAGAMVAGAASP